MMLVQRVRKPLSPDAKYTELILFDDRYAMATLYCQQLCAVPRLVGSVCPQLHEDDGEGHAA